MGDKLKLLKNEIMASKKRNIGFYMLRTTDEEHMIQMSIMDLLESLRQQSNIEKTLDYPNSKFGYLDSIQYLADNTRIRLIFKSATHSYRPPLTNRENLAERSNPKAFTEGDTDKTHIVMKVLNNNDVIFVLEKFKNSITINQFIKYLNVKGREMDEPERFKFKYDVILKDDFLEEITSLDRVVSADLFIDKQILGGAAMNYSGRTSTIQNEIVLGIKASRRESIKNYVEDTIAKFNGGETQIRRIRVTGRNSDNNEVSFSTDYIEKKEYVFVDFNTDTGVCDSSSVIAEMEAVLINYA